MKEFICYECKTYFNGKKIHKCPECKSSDTGEIVDKKVSSHSYKCVCGTNWEKFSFVGENVYSRCPNCNKNVREICNTGLIMKGDCHTNRVKWRKYAREGMDKDTANEFYKTHIKASKTRIAQSPYKRMDLTKQGAKELGMKKVSDSEADKRRATAKRLGPEIQKRLTRK